MPKVMMTFQSPRKPTLDEIRKRYSLSESEVDSAFGVVEIDPDDNLYSIRVEAGSASKVDGNNAWGYSGPYADPKIEPFGPPQS